MDVAVLTLASGGVALTAGGLIIGTCDLIGRVRTYREQIRKADAERSRYELSPVQRVLSAQHAQNVAARVDRLEADLRDTERRLSAVTGAAEKPRRLLASAAVALLGVALSGAADIVAALHAR